MSNNKIKGRRTLVVNASVDVLTDAAIRALVERENLTYSGALCALVMDAALRDSDLKGAIQTVLYTIVQERIAKEGLEAVQADKLASEILGPWHAEAFFNFSRN